MIPLAIGVCLLFAETRKRLANFLIWVSLAALFVAILNSLHIRFRPTTLWQLGTYVVMIAAGGGLMFRGLHEPAHHDETERNRVSNEQSLRREIEMLRQEIKRQHNAPES